MLKYFAQYSSAFIYEIFLHSICPKTSITNISLFRRLVAGGISSESTKKWIFKKSCLWKRQKVESFGCFFELQVATRQRFVLCTFGKHNNGSCKGHFNSLLTRLTSWVGTFPYQCFRVIERCQHSHWPHLTLHIANNLNMEHSMGRGLMSSFVWSTPSSNCVLGDSSVCVMKTTWLLTQYGSH